MASFVESATLKVIDQSSGPINKINAELKKLFATANQLKRRGIDLGLKDNKAAAGAYNKAAAEAKKYATAQGAVARGEKAAAAARLMTTREIIRAQRGLLKVERDVGTARQMSTEQMIRASRGVTKMVEAEARAKQKAEREMVRETERGIRDLSRQNRQRIKETEAGIKELAAIERARSPEARAAERAAAERARAARGAGGTRGGAPEAPFAFTGGRNIREFMTGILGANLITALGHALKEGVIEGTKQYDVGENKLRLMQLDAVRGRGTEAVARAALTNLGIDAAAMKGGAFLNAGQRMGIYAEALGTTSLDPRGAKLATAALEELVRTSVALGVSQDRATDQAYNYVKAADMMGRMVFQHATMIDGKIREAGTFRYEGATDEERATALRKGIAPPDLGLKNFMDYMQKMQPEIGKEFTGEFVRGIAKYLGATRMGVSNQAFGATLLLGEEMGTRAAVGYRQAVKQLSGIEQTKDRIANLADLGLIDFTKTAGKRPKIKVEGVKDAALMAQNLPAWIQKNIAEGQGGPRYSELEKDASKRGRLMDPNSPLAKIEKKFGRAFNLEYIEDVQELGRRLVGNSNALDTLTGYLYNSAEIQKKLATVDKRDPEAVRQILMQSPVVAAAQMQNQFKGVMGAAVVAAAPILTPMMQQISGGLQTMSENVRVAFGPEGVQRDQARRVLLDEATGAAVAGGGAALALKLLGPAISGLGTVAGLQAMMDPKTAPLGAAGLSLQAAAGDLKGAAAMLAGKGLIPGAGAAPGASSLIPGLLPKMLSSGINLISQLPGLADAETQALWKKRTAAEQEYIKLANQMNDIIQGRIPKELQNAQGGADLKKTMDKYNELQTAISQAVENFNKIDDQWVQRMKWPFGDTATRPHVPEIMPPDWKTIFNIPEAPKDIWNRILLPTKDEVRKAIERAGVKVPPDKPEYETYRDSRGRRRRRVKPAPEDPSVFKGPGVRFINPQIIHPSFPSLPRGVPGVPTTGVTTTFPQLPGTFGPPPPPTKAPPDWIQSIIDQMKVPPEGMQFVADATKQAAADLQTGASTMQTALSSGASDIKSAATELAGAGAQAAGAMREAAPGIGSAIASAFAAGASGIRIGVDLGGVPKPGNPGTQNSSATG